MGDQEGHKAWGVMERGQEAPSRGDEMGTETQIQRGVKVQGCGEQCFRQRELHVQRLGDGSWGCLRIWWSVQLEQRE